MAAFRHVGVLLILLVLVAIAPQPTAALQLSVGRSQLAATSVRDLALFAGGNDITTLPSAIPFATVDIYNATGLYTATSALSQARSFLAAGSVGDIAIFAGGRTADNVSDVVDFFNAASQTWSAPATLSQARGHLAGASVADLVIFAGGQTSAGASTAVDVYNATLGSWIPTSGLSQGRYNLAAASVLDLAFFAGGQTSSNNVSAVVDIYSASGQWVQLTTTLSQARHSLAATSVLGLALFAGGMGVGGPSAVVDIYNSSSGQWTTAALSLPRYGLAAASIESDGLAFFAGGSSTIDPAGISSVVDIYNASSGLWTTTSLAQAREFMAGTSVGGRAFFAGGGNKDNVPSVAVDVLPAAPSPSPLPATVRTIQAELNPTVPQVTISSANDADKANRVSVDFASLSEVDSSGTVVQSASLQSQWETVSGGSASLKGNATTSFISRLSNNATLTYTFFTFATSQNISLSNNFSFTASPEFLKFSIHLQFWNWTSTAHKLQFKLAIRTGFSSSQLFRDSPQQGITTIYLVRDSQSTAQPGALARFLDFGLTADGRETVGCQAAADANSSSLIVTFDYFAGELEYDPDLSVLVGARDGSSSGSSDTVLIATAVAVPVAVVLVVLVIVAALVATILIRRRRANTMSQINIGPDTDNGEDQL